MRITESSFFLNSKTSFDIRKPLGFFVLVWGFSLGSQSLAQSRPGDPSLTASQSSTTPPRSDEYCGYLQWLHAQSIKEHKGPTAINQIVSFVNDLISTVNLKDIEMEAINKKMTFEAFQEWAQKEHKRTVSQHYKPKYLEQYMIHVCGEITNSATFDHSNSEPKLESSAEKQFDPEGHPYYNELSSPKNN